MPRNPQPYRLEPDPGPGSETRYHVRIGGKTVGVIAFITDDPRFNPPADGWTYAGSGVLYLGPEGAADAMLYTLGLLLPSPTSKEISTPR